MNFDPRTKAREEAEDRKQQDDELACFQELLTCSDATLIFADKRCRSDGNINFALSAIAALAED